MKKILIICNSCIGLYKFRKELLDKLLLEGNEVYINTPYDNIEILNSLYKMDIKIFESHINRRGINPFEDMKLLLEYFSIIRRIKPNYVLTYTIKPNLYGGLMCKILKVPYLINVTGLGTSIENEGLLKKILIFFYKNIMKRAKVVFFQNESNKEFFTKLNFSFNYKIIPGSGVNLDYYRYQKYPENEIIKFVFVARIMKEKGIEQYFEAAKYIKEKYPNTQFHICGFCEQEYEDKIKELSDKGIVIYHGLVVDMREIYQNIHCVIHPTFYPEGLSNVLLEASALGRPIITTNRPGCREVVIEGKNGFLILEKSDEDLIKKIEKFLKLSWNKKKELGLYGRKHVEENFNRDTVIKYYLEELKNDF